MTAAEASPPYQGMHRRRLRVLVVDDEAEAARTLSRALRGFGYDVRTADTGPDALRELQQSPVDLVVTDVDMPAMSGLELAEEVRRRFPRMPVLFVTGSGADLDVAGSAPTARLAKPVRLDDLHDGVSALVEASTDPATPG